MSLALWLALAQTLFWAHGPQTAPLLKQAGIERLAVPPELNEAWQGQELEVEAVDAAKAEKLPAPGVEYQINRASATKIPWVTAHGWRFLRSPEELFLYDAPGPGAALAAAEAFAYSGRALVQTDEAGLEPLGRMLDFLRQVEKPDLRAVADVAVVDDDSSEVGEVLNLLSRSNLLYHTVEQPDANAKLNVELGSPEYPRAQAAAPHELAAKVRENLTDDRRSLRIYGSQVVVGRLEGDGDRLRVHLLNYAGPRQVVPGLRVRVLGKYARQRLTAEGVDSQELLDVRVEDDATEFTVPEIQVYAIVDLFR